MALALPGGLADRLTTLGFRMAWRAVRLLPARAAYPIFDLAAGVTVRRGGPSVRRLRANYARVRPELDDAALDALVADGVRSYLRYWCDAFRLPDLSVDTIADSVRVSGDEPVRAALATGQGVVMFLGHLGNWDLAGAWSTTQLAPVTTVAERLEPEELFTEFLGFRERLGMTILPLTGGRAPLPELIAAVRAGAFVPLLADRDLTGHGVRVQFCGRQAAMAGGPARIALATGAPLHPVSIGYVERGQPGGLGSGYDLHVHFHDRVQAPAHDSETDPVAAMTQACATALEGAIVADPAQWHMMQRVFTEDLRR